MARVNFSTIVIGVCFLVFALCILVSVIVGPTSPQNNRCPYNHMYQFGDGVFDNGNAVATMPFGPRLPATNLPYGETRPHVPTGRWSDGLAIDYGVRGLTLSKFIAYLSGNATSSNNAITFAVARSPVLDRSFFTARGIRIPPYAASLNIQMSWFRKYLSTSCVTPKDCADKLAKSIFILGDVEANDITFSLIQGKPIQEVQTYVRHITKAQVNAAREAIKLGVKRVILPGSAPIGCYPFVLTELATNDTRAYDDIGCLKSVNNLIVTKNKDLQQAIDDLRKQFPRIVLYYADFYNTGRSLIRQSAISGMYKKLALKACCGVGGKYNYNIRRFCGSPGVPVCPDPSKYLFWDGIHLTQEANIRLSVAIQRGARGLFNCTVSPLSVN